MLNQAYPILQSLQRGDLMCTPGNSGPKLIFLMLFSFLSACATNSQVLDLGEPLVVTPYYTGDGDRIIVNAHVNDQGPYPFLLDTGASISSSFPSLSADLNLRPKSDQSVVIHGLVASGRFPLVDVASIRIGNQNWENPRMVSLPGAAASSTKICGILGIDFLQRYAVGFSAGERVIRLYSPEIVSADYYKGWTSIPLQRVTIDKGTAALYFLNMKIGGHNVHALFDLGADLNMINWPAVYALPLTAGDRRTRAMISGAFKKTRVQALFTIEEVSTSGIHWRNEEFLAADLEIFEVLNYEGTPLVIIGSGLFNQRDFVIDFARNRLLVKTSMKEIDHSNAEPNEQDADIWIAP